MSHKVFAVACFFVGSLSMVACSSTGDDDTSAASAVNANAAAPACYQAAAVPLSYPPVSFPTPAAACQQADLQGFFEACYTATATKATCDAWQQGPGAANNCGACTRQWSSARLDAQGQPTGLPVPATSACLGAQLGSCAGDAVKFSQCSGAVCSTCAAADTSACHAAAAPGACSSLQGASAACFTAHQDELGACIPPTADQIAADPQAGGKYLVNFYIGACMNHAAWEPAPATP